VTAHAASSYTCSHYRSYNRSHHTDDSKLNESSDHFELASKTALVVPNFKGTSQVYFPEFDEPAETQQSTDVNIIIPVYLSTYLRIFGISPGFGIA